MCQNVAMTNTLQYLPMSDVVRVIVDDITPRNRNVNGYGGRVPTRYRIVMMDSYTRRVYAMCYGNSSTLYVRVKGQIYILSTDVEYALRAPRPAATELICTCCLILLANGDESGCRDYHNHVDGSEDHPQAPMSLLPADTSCGILHSEHADGCDPTADDYEECECETVTFSTSPCAGCGTRLHGTRHKVTTWVQG